MVLLSSHLRQVFDSPAWNADLVILPKGVTPEGAIQSVLVGKPAALIPHALFETLSQQSRGSSVKHLGFIPFEDENSKIGVAFTDPVQRGLYSVTCLVLILAFLGLLSTRKNLKSQSDGIGIVLKELGWSEQHILKIKVLQFLCLVLIPLMVGALLSPLGLSMVSSLIFV